MLNFVRKCLALILLSSAQIATAAPSGPICLVCDDCVQNQNSVTAQAQQLLEIIPQSESVYKSDEELDSYFHTYRKDCISESSASSLHNKFLNEYKTYIKAAAEEFNVPYPVLACKMFRESQFDATAKSEKGALGLGQFIADTRETVTRIISDSLLSAEDKNKFAKLQAQVESGVVLTGQPRRDYDYFTNKSPNEKYIENWQNYFANLNKSEKYKKSPYAKYGTPKIFTDLGAKTPPIAIGATALYFGYIINLKIGGVVKTEQDDLDRMVAMAGAYNMGPGNASRFAKRYATDDSPQAYIAALSRVPETKNHMESIRRCLQKNSNQGPVVLVDVAVKGKIITQAQTQSVCPGDNK